MRYWTIVLVALVIAASRLAPAADDARAQRLLGRVMSDISAGRFDLAEQRVDRWLDRHPDDFNALCMLANLSAMQGDSEKLESAGWRIRDVRPDSSWGPIYVGKAALEQRNCRAALNAFEHARLLMDGDEKADRAAWQGVFDANFCKGDWQAAARVADGFPVSDDAGFAERRLLAAAAIKARMGDPSVALRTIRDGGELTLWLWRPFLEQIVDGLSRANRHSEALALTSAFVAKRSNSAKAWTLHARILMAAGGYDAGRAALTQAGRIADPKDPALADDFAAGALAALSAERLDDEIVFYQQALQRGHRDAQMLNNLAWGLFLKGIQTEEALILSEAAVATEESPHYMDTLARLQNRVGRTEEAQRTMERAIDLALFDPYVKEMKAFRRALRDGREPPPPPPF